MLLRANKLVSINQVYFSANTPRNVMEELGAIMGMPIVDNPGTYLSLPTIWGRSKRQALGVY